jgi:hypothetical protein
MLSFIADDCVWQTWHLEIDIPLLGSTVTAVLYDELIIPVSYKSFYAGDVGEKGALRG